MDISLLDHIDEMVYSVISVFGLGSLTLDDLHLQLYFPNKTLSSFYRFWVIFQVHF